MSADAVIGVPVRASVLARALARHDGYRVLERMAPMDRNRRGGASGFAFSGCAIDVETTGLHPERHKIIELAMQRFWADDLGRIIVTGKPQSWFEDPGEPIDEGVTRLTGITDADVAGKRIFDPVATSLIRDADFVVAHNAAFDRKFLEQRLPDIVGKPWVCTLNDVDWRGLGFEGRVLSHLLSQMGWFFEAHRAQSDVTALLHLLDHPLDQGGTVLRSAVRRASQATWAIEAVGAPFSAKDLLRGRGYRWDPEAKLWSREVTDDVLDAELEWVGLEIYGGLAAPRVREVTWSSRYGA
ncbi:MAG: DNA polymerase III subunit epsilon [Sphingomonas sp.]|uniref:3'-5' exonuclease n=1 Tax=Sphingomonas sp. TaxID=28214 RepID=UPI002611E99C|nr:3'-5' exonuclease [Sphingomonas sp.]MDK2768295.1 DNA polymerase III subunit epsilon [Sphingomonas sp.]